MVAKTGHSSEDSYAFLVYALPSLLGVLVYLNGIEGDFVHDDVFAIKTNADVIGTSGISSIFTHDFWGAPLTEANSHRSYRPLVTLWFRFDYHVSNGDSRWFHGVNIVLHGCVTCLVGHVSLSILKTSWLPALFSALLFAVHPIHTEAVTGIVGRAEVSSALFFLLSFVSYHKCLERREKKENNCYDVNGNKQVPVEDSSWWRYFYLFLSMMLAATATLCKETGLTVLGTCFIVDLLHNKSHISYFNKNKVFSPKLLPFAWRCLAIGITLCVVIVFRLWVMDFLLPVFKEEDNPTSFSQNFLTRVLTFNYLLPLNAWFLLCPQVLCYDWQVGSIPLVEDILDVRNLATLLFYLSLLAISVHCVKTLYYQHEQEEEEEEVEEDEKDKQINHVTFVAMGFVCIPFLPASNLFFRVGFVLAERVLYIPSIGYAILVSQGHDILCRRFPQRKGQLVTLMLLLLMTLSVKTWKRNNVWLSRDSLFWSGVKTLPHNAKVHYNLANYLKDSGNLDLATKHYHTAIRLYPNHASYHNNLGTALTNQTEAETHYREALQLLPSHKGAMINLGNLLLNKGNTEEALEILEECLHSHPNYVDALLSMGKVMIVLKRYAEAEQFLNQAKSLEPQKAETHNYFGALFQHSGRPESAVVEFEQAVFLNSQNINAMKNAAVSLRVLGRYDEAEKWLRQALRQQSDSDSYYQLGQLYTDMGHNLDAMLAYRQAMNIAPNDTTIQLNYIQSLIDGKQTDEAKQSLNKLLQTHPENVNVLKLAWKIASDEGNHQAALRYLEEALEQSKIQNLSSTHLLYHELGNSHRLLGDLSKSLKAFQGALHEDPKHAPTFINIGSIYFLQKKYDEAEHFYKQALEIEPHNQMLKDNMRKLQNVVMKIAQAKAQKRN